MYLSEKQKMRLNDACIKQFGIQFDVLYKSIEENLKMKSELKELKKIEKKNKKLLNK